MGEYKNYEDPKNGDLKYADAEKSSGPSSQRAASDSILPGLADFAMPAGDRKHKKKLPILVDVIIGILMLAFAVGVVAGAYYLFRFFSDDYEGIEVEYTFVKIADSQTLTRYRGLKNTNVYIDTEENAHYMGKVMSAEIVELDEDGSAMLVLVISSNAKYRGGEGYTVGDFRIAVGSDYTLRSGTVTVDGTIVELQDKAKEAAVNAAGLDMAEDERENGVAAVSEEGGAE